MSDQNSPVRRSLHAPVELLLDVDAQKFIAASFRGLPWQSAMIY